MAIPLVSIIMPIYNAEEYLSEAIDSLICQDFENWELIAIDDGSVDKSGVILDSFAKKDSRIIPIHQPNKGVSYSRQLGVNKAQGKYCIHVDADDWVEKDYLKSLVLKAEQTGSDLVWCDAFVNNEGKWQMTCGENPDLMIRDILLQKHWGTLWNRLIKREICQNPDVAFPQCAMWEDMSFVIQCLLLANNIAYVNKPLYHYRQISTSLTHQNSSKIMCYEYEKAVNSITRALYSKKLAEKYSYELNSLKLFVVRDYIDDLRIRDYEKFLNTYPEAIAHINEYPEYPKRIKRCYWLLKKRCTYLVHIYWRLSCFLKI